MVYVLFVWTLLLVVTILTVTVCFGIMKKKAYRFHSKNDSFLF